MKTLILGINLRGLADVARACLGQGDEVAVFDTESPEPPADLLGRVTSLAAPWTPEYLDDVDRIVTSPWFAEVLPPLSDAIKAGIDIVSEAGFGLETLGSSFITITGTNGKTTVTKLVTTMLVASGVRALSAGNVGTPVSGITPGTTDVLVVELSSAQLRFRGSAVPIAAGLLNVAPDHLDWHGTFEAYVEAKGSVFLGMAAESVLAYNADDPVVVTLVEEAACSLIPCSGTRLPSGGNGVDAGMLLIGGTSYDATTTDPSFLLDLVVAGTVALAAGATVQGVTMGIDSFSSGQHRRQVVPTSDGIVWIDDSKATNPHATSAAVAALAPVVLLAGGQNKGLDLSPLGDMDGVSKLILFGEAGPVIREAATDTAVVVASLGDAVREARLFATVGDTVLLSPGCASFDAYSSYAERGDEFQRLVTDTNGVAA